MLLRRAAGPILVALLVAWPLKALAGDHVSSPEPSLVEPPAGRSDRARPHTSSWYGWQTLIADGLAGGMLLAGGTMQSGLMGTTGVLTFALAPPLIHASHHEGVNAASSVVVRLLFPFTGLLAGSLLDPSGCAQTKGVCIPAAGFLGGLAGMIGASALDAAMLARTRPEPRFQVTPVATASSRGAVFGVGGFF